MYFYLNKRYSLEKINRFKIRDYQKYYINVHQYKTLPKVKRKATIMRNMS